jgi:hypothetical protein
MVYRKQRNRNLWIKKGKSGEILGSVKVSYSPRGIAHTPYVVTRTKKGGMIIAKSFIKTRKGALNRAKEMMKRKGRKK